MAKLHLTLYGSYIDIEDRIDCPWCGAKGACLFKHVTYDIPCPKCKNTPKYEQLEVDRAKFRKTGGVVEALNAGKPAAVWEGKGKDVITDKNGNIIAETDHKERPLGKKNWKI